MTPCPIIIENEVTLQTNTMDSSHSAIPHEYMSGCSRRKGHARQQQSNGPRINEIIKYKEERSILLSLLTLAFCASLNPNCAVSYTTDAQPSCHALVWCLLVLQLARPN